MPNHKIELSIELDKLTLGITEEETQLQSANKLLTSGSKLIELLNNSPMSTKLVLIASLIAPFATIYIYKQ